MRSAVAVVIMAVLGYGPADAQTTLPASNGAVLYGAGVFSTGSYELVPSFTPDGKRGYFTVSTPAYGRLHVIMETVWDGKRWTTPKLASFSGQYGDADPLISPDGSRLFFLSRRPAPGRAADRQDFDVWFVQRAGNGWGEPQHVPEASGPSDEHYASVAADGTLYVSAVRPDSKGRGDIYRVPFVNGRYGEPENLGAAINSADHHDTTAFIAPDQSYLIFSSFGRPDGGVADLYISFRRDGVWTEAKNLGPLVNSRRVEYCPTVSHDGKYLLFTSERGFADAPVPQRMTTGQWNQLVASPGNGLGDTYRVAMSDVLAAVGASSPRPSSAGSTADGSQIGLAGKGTVSAVVNPERVCYDSRPTPYLNFDIILRNGGEQELQVKEVRAFVTNAQGELLERRIVGQQALDVLGPGRRVAPLSDGLIFNPFNFNAVQPSSRLTYEFHFANPDIPPVATSFTPESCVSGTRLVLPVSGRVAVFDGHDVLSHHRRSGYIGRGAKSFGIIDNTSRFALDLMHIDAHGRSFRGEGRRNEDYVSWAQPVRAAGAGTVVAVHNEQPDNDVIGSESLWTDRSLAKNEMSPSGNYVLIDHGNGEFSLAAHLRAGSVVVKKGQKVQAGDVIGAVGNSGSSLGPHLHYELRTGFGVRGIRGLPPYFTKVTVVGTGEGKNQPVMVNTGDVLMAE